MKIAGKGLALRSPDVYRGGKSRTLRSDFQGIE